MDYSIPIPIKINDKGIYECICKYCSDPNKYVTEYDGYSYLWNKCLMCQTKVWYWHQVCSLYGKRSPYVVRRKSKTIVGEIPTIDFTFFPYFFAL